ncbi:MAG: hypothetical protein AAGF12_01105 [Myxococcota bacterium]
MADEIDVLATNKAKLTSAQRQARSELIREVLADAGIQNPLPFAGLASAETNMAHCWSEATWACKGPNSVDCGGGPVIAGSGDGPCRNKQGGLGLFQFDAGTHTQTLKREGNRILELRGNIAAAGDFVVNMVKNSTYISGVSTDAEAIAWINAFRPSADSDWIKTVVHYYNGCVPGCSVYSQRTGHYRSHLRDRYNEFGHDFWYPPAGATPTPSASANCTDTCSYAGDGECDDGGPDSQYDVCGLGTDCMDCGPRTDSGTPVGGTRPPTSGTCDDSCHWARDGVCDDGRPGAVSASCAPGTDCTDCQNTGASAPMCRAKAQSCGGASTCCGDLSCRRGVTFSARCCVEAADSCTSSSDCCGAMSCNAGRCQCRSLDRTCVADADCCEGFCDAGRCR